MIIVSLVGVAASGTIASANVDADAAEIEGNSSDGETVEVLVKFERPDMTGPSALTAENTLKSDAKVAQSALIDQAKRTSGLTVERQFWITNAALVTVDTERTSITDLTSIEGITALQENGMVRALDTEVSGGPIGSPSNASEFTPEGLDGRQSPVESSPVTYGLDQLNVPEAWSQFDTRGSGARVAVLDTGVDADHSDIELLEEIGWADFDEQGDRMFTEPKDYSTHGHGTHVSATVVGGNASGEHIGVAPDAELIHGAVLTSNCDTGCRGTYAQIIAGMEWAVENDADIISMSLGDTGYDHWYIDPVMNAHRAGSIVVAAAGNDGQGTSHYPANVYDSIAVGATNQTELVASFSSGETIQTPAGGGYAEPHWPDEYIVPDVSAPGEWVKSAVPGDSYGYLRGTSMATPHVSGVVALMESASDDQLQPTQIGDVLTETARKPASEADDQDTRYGHGIVNAKAAVKAVADTTIVSGTLEDHANNPINDGVIHLINAETRKVLEEASLEADGSFEFSPISADAVDVAYYRTQTEDTSLTVEGIPAIYAIDRIESTDSGSLGTITVPEAQPVEFEVTSQTGEPVSNASVRLEHKGTGDAYSVDKFETGNDGTILLKENTTGEIYLSGSIQTNVEPPDNTYVNESYKNIDEITEPTSITVVLKRTPVVESADRTLSDQSVKPGNETTSSLYIDVDRSGLISITESIESQSVTITGVNATLDGMPVKPIEQSITNNGHELQYDIETARPATLTVEYKLKINNTAPTNETLSFAGRVTDRVGVTPVNGTDSLRIDPEIVEKTYLQRIGNEDGIIETIGLLQGIGDWRAEDIDTLRLLDVINHWRTGDRVSGESRIEAPLEVAIHSESNPVP